jgi:hypothetical protein
MGCPAEKSKLADTFDVPQIGDAQATIADAAAAVTLNATFSNAEVEAAIEASNATVNEIIAVLKAHGLIKDA